MKGFWPNAREPSASLGLGKINPVRYEFTLSLLLKINMDTVSKYGVVKRMMCDSAIMPQISEA